MARVVEACESQLISIDLMIARGGRLGGAAHGDTAATYAAFNPSRRSRRRDVFETKPRFVFPFFRFVLRNSNLVVEYHVVFTVPFCLRSKIVLVETSESGHPWPGFVLRHC